MDTKGIFKKAVNLLTLSSFLLWNLSVAAPEGGSVAQGSATISQSGAQTTINQTSQNAVINWNSFNTASHEAVQFNQPNSSAVALNRITNGLPTQFAGSLNANGQVWILNPAGVLFTSTARVDVAGLVATTHGILDSNFMAGNYKFDLVPGSEYSSIINNGLISAKDSGIVALVAPHVANNGLIQVNLGRVSLASGAAYTLDMYGDNLINFGSNAPIQNGSVSNAGKIIADGGKVYMTANSAAGVLDNVISMSGTVQAKSVSVNKKGEIVLYSNTGVTKVTGKLNTSSTDGKIGGFIETSGATLIIGSEAEINAGMGGTWLLDPLTINLSSYGNTVQNILNAGTNVTLSTGVSGLTSGTGDINIDQALTWTTGAVLTLAANNDINISQNITATSGGGVVLHADFGGTAGGTVIFSGGAKVNVTGPATIYYYPGTTPGTANYSTPTNFNADFLGTLPTVYMAIDSTADLATLASQSLIAGVNTANYHLSNNVTYAGTSAIFPTDGSMNGFAGIFDGHNYVTGANNTISGFNITASAGNTPSGSSEAAFTGRLMSTGVIKDVNFSGNVTNGINSALIGGVAGLSEGLISNVNYTGTIDTTSQVLIWQGGIAGILAGGGILSYVTFSGAVKDSGAFGAFGSVIGGLVGQLGGSISFSGVAAGSSVIGTHTMDHLGGIAGEAGGTISNSYSQASVGDNPNTSRISGGIVGQSNGVTLTNVYNSGNVTGSVFGAGFNGAIIGNFAGTVSGAYYNSTNCPACSTSFGGTALTTAQMQNQASFVGYNFANIWMMSGSSPFFPVLQSTANTTSTNTVLGTGSLSLGAIQSIAVYVNGVLSSTVTSNGTGAFAFIYSPDLFGVQTFLATTNSSLPGAILNKINVTGPSFISGLNITLGQVTVNNSAGIGTLSNSDLIVASGPTTPYTVSGNNITLTSGTAFLTSASAPYVLNGNITVSSSGGDITFGGTATLASNAILSSDFGNVTFNNTINGNGSGPWDLTINDNTSAGNPPPTGPGVVTFNGIVGGSNPLNSLTVDSSFGIVMNTSAISTVLTQSYNPNVIFSPAVYLYSPALNLTGSNINFNNSVVINHNLANPNALTITGNMAAAQNAAFRTTTGGFGFVGSLHVTGTSLLGGGVGTQNTQTYDGNVTVTTVGSAFFSSDNTNIIFNSTLKGNGSNTLNFFTTNGATTFNGQVGIAGNGSPLSISNLAITANAININTSNIYTNVNQTYTGPITLLQDTTLTSYTGSETFSTSATSINSSGGARDLTINAPSGTARFDGMIGNSQPLKNVSVTASAIDLRTSQISSTLNQNYTGNMTINNVGLITFTGSNVQFNSPVNSSGTPAQIQIDGSLVLANSVSVGQSSNVAQLIVLNGNSASIRGNITTTGDTTFTGPVVLTADTFITDTGTGIFFDSTVDSDAFGPWSLTTNATAGPVEFDSDVGLSQPLNVLNTTAATGIYLNNQPVSQPQMVINTVGSQTYNGDLILKPISTSPIPMITLTASNAGSDITFNGEISIPYGAGLYQNLFVNAGHDVNINADVLLAPAPCAFGSVCGAYLDVTAGNVINIDAANIEGGGAGVSFTVDSFGFHSPIVLFQPVVHVLALNVADFDSSINSDSSVVGGTALSFDAYSVTTFGGQMGTAVNGALASLSIAAYPTTSLRFSAGANAITTIGNQDIHPPVFYFGNTGMTFTSQSGIVHFYADNTNYYPTGRTAIDTNFTSGYVHVNGDVIFDGDIIPLISANPFHEFSLAGPVIVTGTTVINNGSTIDSQSQDYQQGVTIDGSTVRLNSTGLIQFGSTVDSVSSPTSLIINGVGFTFLSPGSVEMNGAVGSVMPLNNLDVTASVFFGAFIYLNTSSIETTGDQLYHGNVALQTNVDAPGMVASGDIIFDSRIDNAFNLTANATGIVQFNGIVGTVALNTLDVTASQININTSSMTTSGNQVFHSPASLMVSTNLTSTSGNIDFESTVDGTQDLTITGNLLMGPAATMGQTTPLNSLLVTGTSVMGATSISTVNNQTYQDEITFNNISQFFTSSNGSISFDSMTGTVNADGALNITVPSNGFITFYDIVGTTNPIDSIITNGGTVNIYASQIATRHAQTYNSPVVILGSPVNMVTQNFAGANILFNSTIDGPGDLQVNSFLPAFTVTLNGDVGSTTALGSLLIGTGTAYINSLNSSNFVINTTGAQTYNSVVVLGTGASTLSTSAGGSITFGDTVDGGADLTTNATSSGTVEFQGDVGVLDPLNSLTVTGTTHIDTAQIRTDLNQLYNSSILLGVTTLLNSNAGNIDFFGTIDGAFDLSVNAGNTVTFYSAVGGSAAPSNLDVTGAQINVATSGIITDGNQVYSGPVVLSTNTVLTSNNNDVTFNSTVDGPGGLIVNVPNGTMFANDHIGFGTPVDFLTVNGTAQGVNVISVGNITMGPFNVVTNDLVQSLAGNVDFTGGPVTLSANLDVIAAEQIFFGAGANGVTGPFTLSAQSLNSVYGPTGQGVTGTVDVATFILGGPGGGHLSQNYPVTESFVAGQGAGQAIMNTLISPDFRSSGAIYCVNNFCATIPVPPVDNFPTNIPQLEMFNFVSGLVSCDSAGCANLEMMIDNLVEAGVVTCGGMGESGCAFGFMQAQDTNGIVRILMPGDVVYAGDRIMKDENSCGCVKSLYTNNKTCMGPKNLGQVYKN